MDSIISTFHIDWKIIVAQAVNFGVVFAVLYWFALRPLNKLMGERRDKIEKGVEDAKSHALLLSKTKDEYDQAIRNAKAEANNIFEEGKKQAALKKSEMLEAAKMEVAVIIENGKKNLEQEKTKMVEEAKKEISSLAMLAVKKLIEESDVRTYDQKSVNKLKEI